ncbi:hypothetical protein [Microbulbifer sp. ZKSA002]|uniref:hypothetical protein n=1 Tax=Microbulbifer sp. ZKSA002 TaxID=3243388 RepID=UPI0040397CD3
MVMLLQKDECPEYVYKYCTTTTYREHIKNGSFRLGTLAEYKQAYEEKGAEYGDYNEGNCTTIIGGRDIDSQLISNKGALIVDRTVNAYVFSTALNYSIKDHEKWYHRNGCNYDLCLKIRAKDFFIELADAARLKIPDKQEYLLAKPFYNNGFSHSEIRSTDPYLQKSKHLEWEGEYRLVLATTGLRVDSKDHIILKSKNALNFIEDEIEIDKKIIKHGFNPAIA